MKYRLVATAGHVDHGKTSLLKALTGMDADRLDEEKERGLTIDLGFADLREGDLQVGFIDVPGHQNFIKNMVSGVGSVQGILFVVSAVDGWQEQSREHFEIIRMLEPEVLVFALTKIDLADEDFQLLVRAEIEEAVEGTPYETAPVIPVSSESKEGIDGLQDELLSRLNETPDPTDHGKPYCPIDRVFSVKGQGTVVTGSLSGGSLDVGDQVTRMPAEETGRIRDLQQYHEHEDEARFPARTAVNVPDWDREDVSRGDILTVPDAGQIGTVVDGVFTSNRHLKQELNHDQQVLGYSGTDRFPARVLMPDRRAFDAAEEGLLRLERREGEGFYRPGDRIILRDFADRRLLGCLVVGEVEPEPSLQDQSYQDWLRTRFRLTPTRYVESELARLQSVSPGELGRESRFSEAELIAAIDEQEDLCWLGKQQRVMVRKRWEDELEKAKESVANYHQAHPQRRGISLDDWRSDDDPLRPFLRQTLETEGYHTEGELLFHEDFEPRLPDDERETYERLLETLKEAGLESPERDQLEKKYGDVVVEYGVETGELVPLSDDLVLSSEILKSTVKQLEDWMADGEPRRLSEIRDFLGSSRKYVIPLMEYLDQEEITFREGDVRYLRENQR